MVQGWRLERRKMRAIKTQGNKNLELKHGRDDSPLFATAVNSWRLLWWRLEDGLKDGDVLLKYDGWDCEVSLQLVGAFTKVLRQASHVLPLLHLVEELYQAVSRDSDPTACVFKSSSTSYVKSYQAKYWIWKRQFYLSKRLKQLMITLFLMFRL